MQQDKESILCWRRKRSASERADSNIYYHTKIILCDQSDINQTLSEPWRPA